MIAATHPWLRRVSDYHSGGMGEAERTAVEGHLAKCAECQEALLMYRRFYTLARSPWRLGPPSRSFAGNAPPSSEWHREAGSSGDPRRRTAATVAAALVAALIVVSLILTLAPRHTNPPADTTPTPGVRPTATPVSSPDATPTVPATQGFICANPPGSALVYVYRAPNQRFYEVVGCSAPVLLYSGYAYPVAWSPANRYLMLAAQRSDGNDPVVAIDPASGTQIATRYYLNFGPGAGIGQTWRIFIGWLDDQSFLGALIPLVAGGQSGVATGTATIVRVDLSTQAETPVAHITWAADMAVRGGGHYLFYGGYQSASEGQAYLHRINLADGSDTKLVSLGIYGPGPCQGTPVCNWTAPWDVSADGAHVWYHHPGPTSMPSDTNVPRDTPLVYANDDGSGAIEPIGQLASGLTTPGISPDDTYLVASGSSYTGSPFGPSQTALARTDTVGGWHILDGRFGGWRSDSQAMVLFSANGVPLLYTVASGRTQSLQPNTDSYLWGN